MRILPAAFAILILFPLNAFAKTERHASCTFEFQKGQALSWYSVAASATIDGFKDVDKFMYGIMCKWRPNSNFLIGGTVIDSAGYPQMKELSDGQNQVDVTVDGCTFQMTFGKVGSKFNVSDNKAICDVTKHSSHNGVADLYALSSGDYGVRCNDGTSTAITLNNGVYCAVPQDNRSSKCSSSSSFRAMANWVCQ